MKTQAIALLMLLIPVIACARSDDPEPTPIHRTVDDDVQIYASPIDSVRAAITAVAVAINATIASEDDSSLVFATNEMFSGGHPGPTIRQLAYFHESSHFDCAKARETLAFTLSRFAADTTAVRVQATIEIFDAWKDRFGMDGRWMPTVSRGVRERELLDLLGIKLARRAHVSESR